MCGTAWDKGLFMKLGPLKTPIVIYFYTAYQFLGGILPFYTFKRYYYQPRQPNRGKAHRGPGEGMASVLPVERGYVR
jgi:hypothetical protein